MDPCPHSCFQRPRGRAARPHPGRCASRLPLGPDLQHRLAEAGVNLNSKTNDGDTPADNARRNSHKEALKLILEVRGRGGFSQQGKGRSRFADRKHPIPHKSIYHFPTLHNHHFTAEYPFTTSAPYTITTLPRNIRLPPRHLKQPPKILNPPNNSPIHKSANLLVVA